MSVGGGCAGLVGGWNFGEGFGGPFGAAFPPSLLLL